MAVVGPVVLEVLVERSRRSDPRAEVGCPLDEPLIQTPVAGELAFVKVSRVPEDSHNSAVVCGFLQESLAGLAGGLEVRRRIRKRLLHDRQWKDEKVVAEGANRLIPSVEATVRTRAERRIVREADRAVVLPCLRHRE